MDEKQLDKMLGTVASRLGMSKEQLKSAASSGRTDEILSHLDKTNADKIKAAMSNKKTADAIMKAFKDKNGGI